MVEPRFMGGHAWGPIYLLIRVPLQALLVGWVYGFAVRDADQAGWRDGPDASARSMQKD